VDSCSIHSALPEHQNRNFAAFFPFWDFLLGTYHKPKKDEFPVCGMTNGETTDSIWQANVGVFRDWYKLWKGDGGSDQDKPDPVLIENR